MAKTLKWTKLTLSLLLILLCIMTTLTPVYADEKSDFLNAVNEVGSTPEEILQKGQETDIKQQKDDTVWWFLQHLFSPSHYVEDVTNRTHLDDKDNTTVQERNGRLTVCYHEDEPQNLLNHNCDIPSFGTELFQSIFKTWTTSGLINAKTTQAKSAWGFGVPANLPTSEVPINPQDRKHKYTGLEIFGYNLELTSYAGEWDSIQTSSAARFLANVGFWGGLKIGGQSLFKGVGNFIGNFFNNWVFSPLKMTEPKPGFVDGVVSTVVDSADYNIVSSHAWGRPDFVQTLYNVHYLTDREVVLKGQAELQKLFMSRLFDELEVTPEIQEVYGLMPMSSQWPVFVYNSEVCVLLEEVDPNEPDKELKCLRYQTEEEQWNEWKQTENVVNFHNRASNRGISCLAQSSNYQELFNCYEPKWVTLAKTEANHDNETVQKVLEKLRGEFFGININFNAERSIAHYICADEDGKPLGSDPMTWQYVYTQENSRTEEYLNPVCSPVRPSIKGALYGNGEQGEPTDTRYIRFLETQQQSVGNLNFLASLGKWVSGLSAKITNTLLSLSFTNIMETTRLDIVLDSFMKTMRESIFFPLTGLFIGILAVYVFFKQASLGVGAFSTLGKALLIFFLGILLLFQTPFILKTIDEVPKVIDTILLDTTFDTQTDVLCSTDDKEITRSLQCVVWKITTFDPWVSAQWGIADYKELNVENMLNKNSELVGNPTINFGSGISLDNWALWQLSKTKIGTITTEENKMTEGITSKSLYKLVDLQAGPKFAELSDTRFFNAWNGSNAQQRSSIYVFSGIVSFTLMMVLGSLAIVKIETAVLFIFEMFLFIFHILKGLLPNGQVHLQQKLSSLIGLFLRRMLVTFFMIVTLKMIEIVAQFGYTFTSGFVLCMILAVIYIQWKAVLQQLDNPNAPEMSKKGRFKEVTQSFVPRSVNYWVHRKQAEVKHGLAGAVAGTIEGVSETISNVRTGTKRTDGKNTLIESIKEGYQKGSMRETGMIMRKERKQGFGLIESIRQINRVTNEDVRKEISTSTNLKHETVTNVLTEVRQYTKQREETLKSGVFDNSKIVNKKQAKERELEDYKLVIETLQLAKDGKLGRDDISEYAYKQLHEINRFLLSNQDRLYDEQGLDEKQVLKLAQRLRDIKEERETETPTQKARHEIKETVETVKQTPKKVTQKITETEPVQKAKQFTEHVVDVTKETLKEKTQAILDKANLEIKIEKTDEIYKDLFEENKSVSRAYDNSEVKISETTKKKVLDPFFMNEEIREALDSYLEEQVTDINKIINKGVPKTLKYTSKVHTETKAEVIERLRKELYEDEED